MQMRDRFIEDMRLAGLSARTQEAYAQAVGQLVARVGKSPLRVTEEDIREYFLFMTQEKRVARGTATFHYRDRRSDTVRSCTLEPLVFLSRFLQHVLPKGFAKVRSYGLPASRNRARLDAVLARLAAAGRARTHKPAPASPAPVLHRCPVCHVGTMRLVGTLPPRRGPP